MSSAPAAQDAVPPIDPVVITALDQLLPGHEGEFPVGGRSFLVRLPYAGRQVRARCWPNGTLLARVFFVHRLLRDLAETAPGLASVPCSTSHGRSWAENDGAIVDVEEWLTGQAGGGRSTPQLPDAHALHRPLALEPVTLRSVVRRVAELHAHTEAFARTRDVPAAPIDQVTRAINRTWGDWRVRLRPAAPNYPPIQRWLRLGEQILPAALEALSSGELDRLPLVVNHANLWPAHVLVDEEAVRLLDFDSAVAATPLLDLAQLVTRFSGWTGEHAELVIADYASVRGLAPDERRHLPAIAALDLIIEAARLLLYGYAGAIPTSSREAGAARKGALDMLASLEAVQPAVLRAADRVPHARQRQLARIAAGTTKSSGPRKPTNARRGEPKRRPPKD